MRMSLDQIGVQHGTDKASTGHNYLSEYERVLAPYRDDKLKVLEIGGLNGASLRMWAEYFSNAEIVCVDINPVVAAHAGDRISIEIGNASDEAFLSAVVEKHGPFDVIIDDGSHRWDHMAMAFVTLYKTLTGPGIYIAEDVHTNFEGRYAGSASMPFTASLMQIVQFLGARGDARRAFRSMMPAAVAEAAQKTASITFISSSCILTRRTEAASAAKDAEVAAA